MAAPLKGTYLENYLESVATLPNEMRRNFALLRELDSRSQECIEKVEQYIDVFVQGGKRAARDVLDEKTAKTLRTELTTCIEYADEKVALAVQTYELVDKHIRRLDQDLRKFEAELESTPQELLQETEATSSRKKDKKEKRRGKEEKELLSTPIHDSKKRGKEDFAAATPSSSARKGAAVTVTGTGSNTPFNSDARTVQVDADMPIDPNEPTYCFCSRVSFGEMVGCDNPDCKVEWFHFECVGLTNPPKGKWFCPDCSAALKKKHLYK